MKKTFKKNIIKLLIIIVCIISILYLKKFDFVKETIKILVFSFILSYSLKPIYISIIEKYKINNRIVAFLLILAVMVVTLSIIFLFLPKIFKESVNIESIMKGLDDLMMNLNSRFKDSNYKIFSVLYEQLSERVNMLIANYSSKFIDAIIDFSEDILSLAVVPIVSYYFLADSDIINKKFLLLFSSTKRKVIKDLEDDVDRVLGKYILSQLILCLIVGVLTFIGLIILKIQFPIFLSILNAIVNIIPYFGAILGSIPIILIALANSPSKAILAFIMCILIQQIEGNILSPQITSTSVSMHPLIVIILLLIGDKLGGFIGMILAVPIGVIIKVIYEDINYNLF
ncbi:Predicted PurR-regulated permease PerM [Clostridium cavendishii DSM 21758]|uniref:Predicted PurR-regulated permease PerM n=1 Tax=Clostridium cavendishii DSM 21758 TaxID=1121302 RepID=A0A1M6KFN0_9CLOT|nr:AI-2E family transporter [Clostridium cavendishii]SHJ57728.1 Predicted PurR-regulated permease PerM [Clostridium cavendishii DSM 21758]